MESPFASSSTNPQQRKDEFLATLAHELRNPLAPIRNALHVLRHKNRTRCSPSRAATCVPCRECYWWMTTEMPQIRWRWCWRAEAAGFDAHLIKPADIEELLSLRVSFHTSNGEKRQAVGS
jgi:signal transduction histidine kinase